MTAPSTGLLAMGTGVLAIGRTTLVTIVGAMRTALRTWVTPCWGKLSGARVLDAEPAMHREETSGPPPPPPCPPSASSLMDPPSLPSSSASLPFFLFLSGPSSAMPPPPALLLAEFESEGGMEGEEEEGREERDTGWKPCWRGERERGGGGGDQSKNVDMESSSLLHEQSFSTYSNSVKSTGFTEMSPTCIITSVR